MTNKKLKVGVIGLGDIARSTHLPAWKELESEGRVELIAVCDIIEESAQTIADEFGAKKIYNDYAQMFQDGEFDIIDICTPNRYHCPMTLAALGAGANVLVEKPIAMNATEAQEMINAANSEQRKLMVAQHQRFSAANEKLKAIIESGELGQIYTSNARYLRRRGIPGWGKFHIKKESRGGPLIDLGVHTIDLCFWLMGSPKPISASGKVYRMFGDREDLCNADWGESYPAQEFDVEDYAIALVRFENNISMIIETSWAANIPKNEVSISILGDKAGISTNPLGIYGYQENALTSTTFDWLPKKKSHREEIRHFTKCLEKDLPVRVQPEESLLVQKIIDAIYESSEKNREVVIE